MALSLGAAVGVPSTPFGRTALQSPTTAVSSGRARLRVSCQATFGGGSPKPGPKRVVREQSPNRVQALAMEAAERQQLAASAPPPQQSHADLAVERQRRKLESLYFLDSSRVPVPVEGQPPAGSVVEVAAEEEQEADEAQQQRRERQLQSATASTSGRGQQQQRQRQKPEASCVLSTRNARPVSGARRRGATAAAA